MVIGTYHKVQIGLSIRVKKINVIKKKGRVFLPRWGDDPLPLGALGLHTVTVHFFSREMKGSCIK
ncbi:hypothetical protein AKJ01_03915 [Streptococcus pneumoniae]|nr:hypothetical protein AKJ01_03915 [Streptococcus pneumoniae]